MAFLESILNPVFGPFLALGPAAAILILSLLISLITTLVYKYATNQVRMKELKDQMSDFKKKMKEHKSDPAKMMEMQKEAMKHNMEYMRHSLKATLITFLPIILIFGWMNAHLTYEPIYPGEQFVVNTYFKEGAKGMVTLTAPTGMAVLDEPKKDINSVASWTLKAEKEGTYALNFNHDDKTYTKEVLITKEYSYADKTLIVEEKESPLKTVDLQYEKLRPLGNVSIFGWQPGWLAIYIVSSLVFSLGLRKVMKVY